MILVARLNENLAYSNTPTALAQTLLHGLARSYYAHAAHAFDVLDALVLAIGRRDHFLTRVRQLIQTLFD